MAQLQAPDALRGIMENKRIWVAVAAVMGVVILLVVLIFSLGGKSGGERIVAHVRIDGAEILTVDLFDDGLIAQSDACKVNISEKGRDLLLDLSAMQVPMVLRLKDHQSLRVEKSDCKDQDCVKHGFLSKEDDSLACSQNKLSIFLEQKVVL